MATLMVPIGGLAAAAVSLGGPLGGREIAAAALTLAGVALALRRTSAMTTAPLAAERWSRRWR